MAHHQQNISKGVLSYFIDIILTIELAAFLQIQPFIRWEIIFWQDSTNACLKFSGPALITSLRVIPGFILIPPGKTKYHHFCDL